MSVELFKCEKCGNIVLSVEKGTCTPKCCGEEMKPLVANSVEASLEKHVPVISHENGKLLVTIGSALHPMTEAHYIEFVIFEGPCGAQIIKHLKPGQTPVVKFPDHEHGTVYAYCNLHGLWKKEF